MLSKKRPASNVAKKFEGVVVASSKAVITTILGETKKSNATSSSSIENDRYEKREKNNESLHLASTMCLIDDENGYGNITSSSTIKSVAMPPSSQISEDEHINQLERSGELRNVFGSQSMLSQELYALRSENEDSKLEDNLIGSPSLILSSQQPEEEEEEMMTNIQKEEKDDIDSEREQEQAQDLNRGNNDNFRERSKTATKKSIVKDELSPVPTVSRSSTTQSIVKALLNEEDSDGSITKKNNIGKQEEQQHEKETDDCQYTHEESQEYLFGQSSQQTYNSLARAKKFGVITDENSVSTNNNTRSSRRNASPGAKNLLQERKKKADKFFSAGSGKSITNQLRSSNRSTCSSDNDYVNNSQFGTLLDAVNIFQEQEEHSRDRIFSKKGQNKESICKKKIASAGNRAGNSSRQDQMIKKKKTINSSAPNKRRKINRDQLKGIKSEFNLDPASIPVAPSSSLNKTKGSHSCSSEQQQQLLSSNSSIIRGKTRKKGQKDQLNSNQQQEMAQRAAELAQLTINDPELTKKLLLSMALVRENPRSAPTSLPPIGTTVKEGFFWSHFPPLENVLKNHMQKYYDLSITKCQSSQQQLFNNELVTLVGLEATKQGWEFDQSTFTSIKILRDRIRCYYKTHIQNAKKRLRTMLKNPTKRSNSRHLCSHFNLIEGHSNI